MKNSLALFDLDYTLLTCDSDVEWSRFLLDKGYIDRESEKKREQYSEDYHQGVLNLDEFLEFQLGTLAKFSRTELQKMHQQFMQEYIIPHIKKEAQSLVDKHLQAKDDLILVSATNEFIITPIAHYFKIPNVIGVTLETDKTANYTGKYLGIPSYREGKVKRVEEWLFQQQKKWDSYQETYFYSDSYNDLSLLKKVSKPTVVNPDQNLLAYALANSWPVLTIK